MVRLEGREVSQGGGFLDRQQTAIPPPPPRPITVNQLTHPPVMLAVSFAGNNPSIGIKPQTDHCSGAEIPSAVPIDGNGMARASDPSAPYDRNSVEGNAF